MPSLHLSLENVETLPDGGPVSFEAVGTRSIDVGRASYLDWTLPDPSVSGHHCEIRYRDGGYWLTDHSTNGTYLNGSDKRLSEAWMLRDGDRLEIGPYIVAVQVEDEAAAATPPPVAVAAEPAAASLWDAGDAAPPAPKHAARAQGSGAPMGDALDWHVDLPEVEPASSPASDVDVGWAAPRTPPEPSAIASRERFPPEEPSPSQDPRAEAEHVPSSAAVTAAATEASVEASEAPGEPDPADTEAEPNTPGDEAAIAPAEEAAAAAIDEPPEAPPAPKAPETADAAARGEDAATAGWGRDPIGEPHPAEVAAPPDMPAAARDASAAEQDASAAPPRGSVGTSVEGLTMPRRPGQDQPFSVAPGLISRQEPSAPSPRSHEAPASSAPSGVPIEATRGSTDAANDPTIAPFVEALAAELGVPKHLLGEQSPEELARRIGRYMRLSAEGMHALLKARASSRGYMRAGSATMVQAVGNNPLKFMPTPEDALRVLLGPTTRAYLDVDDTLNESFADVGAHQTALYAAMQAAVQRMFLDLEPGAIETGVEEDSSLGRMIGNRKARLWDAYKQRYNARAEQHDHGMVDVFLMYFSEAYERALNKP